MIYYIWCHMIVAVTLANLDKIKHKKTRIKWLNKAHFNIIETLRKVYCDAIWSWYQIQMLLNRPLSIYVSVLVFYINWPSIHVTSPKCWTQHTLNQHRKLFRVSFFHPELMNSQGPSRPWHRRAVTMEAAGQKAHSTAFSRINRLFSPGESRENNTEDNIKLFPAWYSGKITSSSSCDLPESLLWETLSAQRFS